MNHQKQIRMRMIDLIDQHGDTFEKCKGCPFCKEIMQLRTRLDHKSSEKFAHILAKGDDMTKSDIEFLLNKGIDKKTIWRATTLTLHQWEEMIMNYGFARPRKTKGELKMIKASPEMYQDLKVKGLKEKEIAHEFGIIPQKLSQLKKKWFGNDIQPILASVISTETNTTLEKQNDKSAEYERLMSALRKDVNDLTNQIDDKDEQLRNQAETIINQSGNIDKLNEELHELNVICEEQSKEILSYKNQLSFSQGYGTDIARLAEENTALRQLLKLWM